MTKEMEPACFSDKNEPRGDQPLLLAFVGSEFVAECTFMQYRAVCDEIWVK